jgi:hypothetical protein
MADRRIISLPFHYQRKVASTPTLTGYAKGAARLIQSSGLSADVGGIALVSGTTWRITLSGTPATVDISTVQVGDVVECYSVGSQWDAPQLFIVLAKNVGAKTIDVTNATGAAYGAGGSIRVFVAVPQYTYVDAFQRGIVFNAAPISANASRIIIRNPYICVQASQGVSVSDAQLDFITIFIAQSSKQPFRALFEGIGVNLNAYADRDGGGISFSIAPGSPEQYERIALAPAVTVLENGNYPQGNNLYLETSSGDLTEYQKINLEEWVEKLDPDVLAIPIPPLFAQQLVLEHNVKSRRGTECLLVFVSIGNENTDSSPQLIKGRVVFELEAV